MSGIPEKWTKVRIELSDFFNPKYTSTSCIVVREVVVWSPPRKEKLKYPFLRGNPYTVVDGMGGVSSTRTTSQRVV